MLIDASSLSLVRVAGTPPAELLEIDTPAAAAATPLEDPFRAMLELLFGIAQAPPSLPALAGLSAAAREFSLGDARGMRLLQTGESERCTFSASGSICLADVSRPSDRL